MWNGQNFVSGVKTKYQLYFIYFPFPFSVFQFFFVVVFPSCFLLSLSLLLFFFFFFYPGFCNLMICSPCIKSAGIILAYELYAFTTWKEVSFECFMRFLINLKRRRIAEGETGYTVNWKISLTRDGYEINVARNFFPFFLSSFFFFFFFQCNPIRGKTSLLQRENSIRCIFDKYLIKCFTL